MVSCISVKDYFYQKKKNNIYEFNQSKIESIDNEIAKESDTILKFFCNDYEICDSNCNYIFWMYKNQSNYNLQKVEYGYAKFKMSDAKKYIVPEAKILFKFIENNQLDTVKSEIATDWSCDHCGGFNILYKINNDTIINQYIEHGQLLKGDTNHISYKYSKLVINQLDEIRSKYR